GCNSLEQFIIFIIIPVVSFLFNRNNKNQQNEGKQYKNPQPRPNVPSPQTFNEQRQQTRRPVQKQLRDWTENKNSTPRNENTQATSPYARKREELAYKMEKIKQEEEKQKKEADICSHQVEQIKTHPKRALRLLQDDVLKGIVMSEVLGPTKCRKPYQRR